VILYELLSGSLPFSSDELRSKGHDSIRGVIQQKVPARPSTQLGGAGGPSIAGMALAALRRELSGDRWARAMEHGRAAPERVRPIPEQHVQVRIEVERRAETLNQRHCAGPGTGSHGMAGAPDQKARDAALNDSQIDSRKRG
jgi:hypothetical protein